MINKIEKNSSSDGIICTKKNCAQESDNKKNEDEQKK